MPDAAETAALREQPGARLHVAPALSAARVALVAALATRTERPILYVVGSTEAALRAREDLCLWLDPGAVLLFPAGDALPYEHMSPGADVIAGRLKALRRLEDTRHETRDVGEPDRLSPVSRLSSVIVAPIKALLQPTLSPAEWAAATVRLRRGDEHNPEELIRRWVAMGYRVAPTVDAAEGVDVDIRGADPVIHQQRALDLQRQLSIRQQPHGLLPPLATAEISRRTPY